MDIQAFFQLCDGKWISQRTTHQLLEQNNQSGRSDLWGEILDAGNGEVVALCQQLKVDPALALCGLRLRWSEVAEAYQSKFKPKNEGVALMVAISPHQESAPHGDSAATPAFKPSSPSTPGQILRSLNADHPGMGTFSIGTDEALTLRFEDAGAISEERIWFASPNLRLRSSSIQQNGVVCITMFCSEIRMVAPAATPSAENTATQSGAPS
jgi:CpeS-like protein